MPPTRRPQVPPPRRSREERRAETRAALVRSAADVIARRGYHAASVDEIAAGAGYTVGALYSNFAGKEELLLAAAQQNVVDWARLFAQRFREQPDASERARAIASSWIAGVSEEPEPLLLWVELWIQAVRGGPLRREELAARSHGIAEAFAAIVTEVAHEVGAELSPELAGQLGQIFEALGLGFAMRRLLDPPAVPPGRFEDASARVLDALVAGLPRVSETGSAG